MKLPAHFTHFLACIEGEHGHCQHTDSEGLYRFTEVAPGVNVELDKKGNVLGVEILTASHTLKGFLKSLGKKHVAAS